VKPVLRWLPRLILGWPPRSAVASGLKPVVSACALLVLSDAAHAAGGEDVSAMTLVWQAVNLLLLLGVLVYLTRKPIQDFFRGRHEQVKTELSAAAGVLSDAEARLAEWQARADRLESEVEDIKRAARERAEAESRRILADAEASAERIRRDAGAAVEQEVARAREELRAEAADLATRLAADLLRQHVSDNDQRKLVDEFVSRVETSADGSTH